MRTSNENQSQAFNAARHGIKTSHQKQFQVKDDDWFRYNSVDLYTKCDEVASDLEEQREIQTETSKSIDNSPKRLPSRRIVM